MRAQGAQFEQRARRDLEQAGLRLLTQNFTTRHGELDLVMRDGEMIVFVEVRQRGGRGQGGAAASITRSKRERLLRTASLWLAAHPQHGQRACRFDVVSFDGVGDQAQMHWLRSAFEAE
ncbi:YraN family protein [Dyella sp.]|jgi:putative endonuclease|uniref:YraN family protein n=1 Tax=Dyella sp. TaxID=1869338 RepID=UPI002D79FFDB|nr:YraN family protein [Dyella sp.]HET6433388.1 YraN family protein [Dyella sp.]